MSKANGARLEKDKLRGRDSRERGRGKSVRREEEREQGEVRENARATSAPGDERRKGGDEKRRWRAIHSTLSAHPSSYKNTMKECKTYHYQQSTSESSPPIDRPVREVSGRHATAAGAWISDRPVWSDGSERVGAREGGGKEKYGVNERVGRGGRERRLGGCGGDEVKVDRHSRGSESKRKGVRGNNIRQDETGGVERGQDK
ncbi:hypothetical protein B0H17DRAFT_1123496 [Mycena rosella]|uniref:Uncharacterized protein n=1 Tax=Mycena rosella TaxID=1033263 RepID=A0AAD7H1U3_MYCRO|nr:hypothetical protein B0H17DRAFT_1123496 [Mycena rosella]